MMKKIFARSRTKSLIIIIFDNNFAVLNNHAVLCYFEISERKL